MSFKVIQGHQFGAIRTLVGLYATWIHGSH